VTARWHGRRGFAGGLGVARPMGTPWGSDDGCAGQGGAAGLSPERTDGGGAEKTSQRGDVPRRRWSFNGQGGRR
jgi:hypothetical protein